MAKVGAEGKLQLPPIAVTKVWPDFSLALLLFTCHLHLCCRQDVTMLAVRSVIISSIIHVCVLLSRMPWLWPAYALPRGGDTSMNPTNLGSQQNAPCRLQKNHLVNLVTLTKAFQTHAFGSFYSERSTRKRPIQSHPFGLWFFTNGPSNNDPFGR